MVRIVRDGYVHIDGLIKNGIVFHSTEYRVIKIRILSVLSTVYNKDKE